MWHQIGFFLWETALQQGMKSSQLSLLGGNKGIPICYKKVSAYKHSQCSTKLCHMNFNVTQVWKIPKEQRQHSPVPHYTNDLFWCEQHTTLQSNLFQRRVTQVKCNGFKNEYFLYVVLKKSKISNNAGMPGHWKERHI